MRLGVFGGTFNPVHSGHLRGAEETREMLQLQKVLFIPSGTPPLKTAGLAPSPQRLAMARLAVEGNRHFEVLDIECEAEGRSYTVKTLEALASRYHDARLFFIMGIDAFLDIPNWWQPERFLALCTPVVLARPGYRFADLARSAYVAPEQDAALLMDAGGQEAASLRLRPSGEALLLRTSSLAISSTDIRRRAAAGRSIKYLLPGNVESFIISQGLYSRREP
jgi:nicotinate-nucleotide adenylyltransferase